MSNKGLLISLLIIHCSLEDCQQKKYCDNISFRFSCQRAYPPGTDSRFKI